MNDDAWRMSGESVCECGEFLSFIFNTSWALLWFLLHFYHQFFVVVNISCEATAIAAGMKKSPFPLA